MPVHSGDADAVGSRRHGARLAAAKRRIQGAGAGAAGAWHTVIAAYKSQFSAALA